MAGFLWSSEPTVDMLKNPLPGSNISILIRMTQLDRNPVDIINHVSAIVRTNPEDCIKELLGQSSIDKFRGEL